MQCSVYERANWAAQ